MIAVAIRVNGVVIATTVVAMVIIDITIIVMVFVTLDYL